VDLLKLITPEKDAVEGEWQIRDGALLSPTTHAARLQIPYTPPPEYRIDMEIERQGTPPGTNVTIGFLVGGRQTALIMDRTQANMTSLDGVDGVPSVHAARIHTGRLLFPSRPAKLSLTVRRERINLSCDGTEVFDWSGDPRRLIRSLYWGIPDPKKPFLITFSPILIRKMILTPLPAAGR
jgi:hypothetical protein